MAEAELFSDGRQLGPIRVRNLSDGGLGGSGFRLQPTAQVQVQLNGIGLVDARVIWTKGNSFGLAFRDPVSVAEFDPTGDMCGGYNFATNAADQGYFRRYSNG